MFDYIKKLNFEKIMARAKPVGIAAACLAAVFAAGFGSGQMYSGTFSTSDTPDKRTFSNYNTNSAPTQTETKQEATTEPPPNTNQTTLSDCPVKGSKSKIYHLPGGSFYERTNAAQCFATEAEAQAAGYTKSSR